VVSSKEVAFGSLLFLLYVNSLINIFDNDVTCHLFADDVQLYTVIKTTDCTSLQKGVDKVYMYDWSVAPQLPTSVRKCSCIVLGNVKTLNGLRYW